LKNRILCFDMINIFFTFFEVFFTMIHWSKFYLFSLSIGFKFHENIFIQRKSSNIKYNFRILFCCFSHLNRIIYLRNKIISYLKLILWDFKVKKIFIFSQDMFFYIDLDQPSEQEAVKVSCRVKRREEPKNNEQESRFKDMKEFVDYNYWIV